MPASDFSEHPTVQAIDAAIHALTYLRENGTKRVEVSPEIWQAFKAKPITGASQTPTPVITPLPEVPPPSRVERGTQTGTTDTPEQRHLAHQTITTEIQGCANCPCASETRYLGHGNLYNPRLFVVNGACRPGDDDTAIGSRLEGEAADLLRNMFAAIQLSEEDLYLTATLKCPVSGRPPVAALQSCTSHLHKEIALINPEIIVMLGDVAARAVIQGSVAATGKVGQWHLFNGKIPAIKLHHPQRILMLHDEALAKPLKRENWAALKLIQARLRAPNA